ncbi:MAG: glutamine--fructose-6-phosphate transaminase (isomerizing) [Xanthomonadales bacterium]|nr:glutamine--fructose-6-phosphate transaminase (isomerizing) [Gammaproteobacteria bacterium]MBT8053484.1 glutamine--fructose-6-phosphate transaminase (isomerizing) [Gammaproteobacteria bacterium]NND55852.1 glutamine--fructose-6-phosphate transaminase (isomerizing) [Xanthomonadales bacterium]NNK50928.1 glutamine--fructose-6-phosphate transaminase (isomerizing) [Xanthomonadales bacterium]
MCGIVAASTHRNVSEILISGLRALEYRGYDSAGVAIQNEGILLRQKTQGKVQDLDALLQASPLSGHCGIAHTRWATHGVPSTANAHPHLSRESIALVHNGIIENHEELREELLAAGYEFNSETDTEVMVHLVHRLVEEGNDLFGAVREAVTRIRGAFAIAVVSATEPGVIVGARQGSPLVLGIGFQEHYLASDIHPLLGVTNRFIYLEEGDVVRLGTEGYDIRDREDQPVERAVKESDVAADAAQRGTFRHFMQKEIFEQPAAVAETLEGRIGLDRVLPNIFGVGADTILKKVKQVHIVACGTSFHAGLVARYQLEELAGIPCMVEVASEYRYRHPVIPENALFVAISQSGETADTLAALRHAKAAGYLATLVICNVPESTIVREADLVLMTRAGPEIGVASTKAFTTQLVALQLLVLELAQLAGLAEASLIAQWARDLHQLPELMNRALELDGEIEVLAEQFVEKHHALFLGRGSYYPVAMEGALKLKEISYIHAEAYPAGELKHGPLALVDHDMPVVAVAPNNTLLEKLISNIEEVRARGGEMFVIADAAAVSSLKERHGQIIKLETGGQMLAPVVLTVPLQLLAYHVAVLRGTDVDQPRNLAKSVTVE